MLLTSSRIVNACFARPERIRVLDNSQFVSSSLRDFFFSSFGQRVASMFLRHSQYGWFDNFMQLSHLECASHVLYLAPSFGRSSAASKALSRL